MITTILMTMTMMRKNMMMTMILIIINFCSSDIAGRRATVAMMGKAWHSANSGLVSMRSKPL